MPNDLPDRVEVIRVEDGKRYTIPRANIRAARESGKYKLPSEFPTQFEKERTQESPTWEGVKEFGKGLASIPAGMAETLLSSTDPAAAFKTGTRLSLSDIERKQAGRSIPYRVLSGGAQATGIVDPTQMEAASARGSKAGVIGAALGQAAPVLAPKALRMGDEALTAHRIAKATTEIKKGMTSGVTSEFGPRLQRTIEGGYLTEIENQFKPKDMRELSRAVLDTADKVHKFVEDAVNRHPKEIISGDAIAQGVMNIMTPGQQLFPNDIKAIVAEARRYKGQNIPLPVAYSLLDKLNALDRSLRNAEPANAAAARKIDSSRAAVGAAADTLRSMLYTKLESVGEPGIAEFQKDYGALRTVGEVAKKNIPRAERIGKGPSLYQSAIKSHPYLTLASMGLFGLGAEYGHGGLGVASAALPFLRWSLERRGVPNALIDRAMGRLGKVDVY